MQRRTIWKSDLSYARSLLNHALDDFKSKKICETTEQRLREAAEQLKKLTQGRI